MKTYFTFLIILLTATIYSCQERESPVAEPSSVAGEVVIDRSISFYKSKGLTNKNRWAAITLS